MKAGISLNFAIEGYSLKISQLLFIYLILNKDIELLRLLNKPFMCPLVVSSIVLLQYTGMAGMLPHFYKDSDISNLTIANTDVNMFGKNTRYLLWQNWPDHLIWKCICVRNWNGTRKTICHSLTEGTTVLNFCWIQTPCVFHIYVSCKYVQKFWHLSIKVYFYYQ